MTRGIIFINTTPQTIVSVRETELLASERRSHTSLEYQRARKERVRRRKLNAGYRLARRLSRTDTDPCCVPDLVSWTTLYPLHQRECLRPRNHEFEEASNSDSDDDFSAIPSSSVLKAQPSIEIEFLSKIFWQVSARSYRQFCNALKTKTLFTEEWLHFLHDEAFYHVGGALIKYEYGRLVDPMQSQPEVIDHKIKALRIIRKRITESSGILDDPTLLAIIFLPVLENVFSASNPDNVHWTAIIKLLRTQMAVRRSGSEPFGTYVVEVLNQFDTIQKSLLDLPLLPMPRHNVCIPFDIPIGFQILEEQTCIGKTATNMVYNLMAILEDRKWGTFGKHHTQPDQSEISSSFMDTWHLSDFRPSSIPSEPSIENIITIAALMYTARVVAGPFGLINMGARCSQAHLVRKLLLCHTIRSDEEENALFWSWVVLIGSLKTRLGQLSLEGLKLCDMFAQRFPGHHRSRSDSRSILEQFFCDGDLWNDYKRFMLRTWSDVHDPEASWRTEY